MSVFTVVIGWSGRLGGGCVVIGLSGCVVIGCSGWVCVVIGWSGRLGGGCVVIGLNGMCGSAMGEYFWLE